MVAFAFLGNTLFLTILVSMLSNTFSNLSANAAAEIQFRRAVLTLEGVKADAVFAYQPPFNLLAVFLLLPLKFVVSPRWFHKIHVATVRFVNLPLLLVIAVAERRLLRPTRDDGVPLRRTGKRWFWQRWQFSANRYIRSVFDEPPPDDVQSEIAADDDMTQHLIRRQFTRTNTGDFPRKPSRRDSMFPGIRKKLRGSFSEGEDDSAAMANKVKDMEKSMKRMELMLAKLLPDDCAIDFDSEEPEEEIGESSTLREGDGITAENSFEG